MLTLDQLINNQQLNIAIESRDQGRVKNLFSNMFSGNLFQRLDERLTVLFSEQPIHGFKMVSVMDKRLLDWANKESYLMLGDVSVYAPTGLKVSYMEYIEALENALGYLVTIETELLDPTVATMGALLNDPQLLTSRSGLRNQFNGKLFNVKTDDVIKPISKCFDSKLKEDTIKYKQAFRRNKDISDVGARMMQLQDNILTVDLNRVEKKSKTIFELAEKLALEVSESAAGERPETPSTKLVSERLFECAQWVEFFAVFQRQLLVLSTALKDTEEKLKKLAKK